MADAAIITLDPYARNSPPYLTGLKVAVRMNGDPECPPALSGSADTVYKHPNNIGAGTQFKGTFGIRATRSHQVKLCEYRSSDKAAAVSLVSQTATTSGSKNGAYSGWYGKDRHSTIEGCQNDKSVWIDAVRDTTATKPYQLYHQVVAVAGTCPTWTTPISGYPDLNLDCKGATVPLCGQTIDDAKQCCMGKKSGGQCRADQVPKSSFCDQFMPRYCKDWSNLNDPACKCLVEPKYSLAELAIFKQMKPELTPSAHCNSPVCVADLTAYRTANQAAMKCPSHTITNCSIKTGNINFDKFALGNKVNFPQNCGNDKGPAPPPYQASGGVVSKTGSSELLATMSKNKVPLIIIAAIMFVLMIGVVLVI